MKELVFATHNPNKLREIRSILPEYTITSLGEIGFYEEIAETGSTLYENALLKVRAIYGATGKACFADDTGLEVAALNGAPGVFSARYAGAKASPDENIDKLLSEMSGVETRSACFRTVIAVMNTEGQYCFCEGEVLGTILNERRGAEGFGYDPIFLPEGAEKSFAEMSAAEKNQLSHRAKAIAQLNDCIEELKTHRFKVG